MTKYHNIGDNSHGFNNELLIVKALNDKMYKNLNTHLKKFINTIATEHSITIKNTTKIKAEKACREIDPETNTKINAKPDFYIELEGAKFGVSTKMGTGNSVHQEKVESFITWMKSNNNIKIKDTSIFDDLRLFIWGDGTLDGSAPVKKDDNGLVIGRFTTKNFKSLYPDKHKKIQNFLNENSSEIIKRTLFLGKTNTEVHYVYHGTDINGVWISQKDILNFNLNNPLSNSTFNVGRLSFQIYNADSKGTESGRTKRGNIQLKYSTIEKDILKLMLSNTSNAGTYEGNLEEFSFSKMMNKNRKHKFWKCLESKLSLDKKNFYYIVKVEGFKYSKIANKKVMCKTDNYLIETKSEIDPKLLLKNEYQLRESDLTYIKDYKTIPNSGISIKLHNSKSYTITKMTINNFVSIFKKYLKNPIYIGAAIIFYCTESQVNKNAKIAKNLNIDEKLFFDYIYDEFKVKVNDLSDFESLSLVTKKAKSLIIQTIESNIELKEALFTGKGWFEAPYYINFLYSFGELTDNVYGSYRIDNGSGRSKGKYTIIIKPQ